MPRPLLLLLPLLPLLALTGCHGDIYLRDGVTDGNLFVVAPQAAANPDPVVQSWIRYSLSRSVCQLETGTDNPARANSFDCELGARRQLAEAWDEHTFFEPALRNRYLDELSTIRGAGYLDEYVADEFGRRDWSIPDDLEMDGYRRWRRSELRRHRAETRIIGSWTYRSTGNDQRGVNLP